MTDARTRPPLSETFPHIRTPWKAIAAEVREACARGELAAGEPLPHLGEMATLYGVNRVTAAKALRALAAEGLVELEPGIGYFATGAPKAHGAQTQPVQ